MQSVYCQIYHFARSLCRCSTPSKLSHSTPRPAPFILRPPRFHLLLLLLRNGSWLYFSWSFLYFFPQKLFFFKCFTKRFSNKKAKLITFLGIKNFPFVLPLKTVVKIRDNQKVTKENTLTEFSYVISLAAQLEAYLQKD